MEPKADLDKEYKQLLEELKQIGEFRRGSINIQFRKCGKPRCACTKKGHPGHGPRTTLTYKKDGKTRTTNLPTSAAVELVHTQIQNHDIFTDWFKRWRDLNERISDHSFEEILSEGESAQRSQEKKRKSTSSKKSGAKSKD